MNSFYNIYNQFIKLKYIDKIKQLLIQFFDSDVYIITLMFTALLNWKLKVITIIFTIGVIFFFLIYFFKINKIRLIPLALFVVISLRLDNIPDYLAPVIVGSIIVLPLFLFDLFKRKITFHNKILIGMILLWITMFFSIINAPNLIKPILGILMWFFYIILFLYFYNKREESNSLDNNRDYLAKSFVYFGLAISLEIILFYLEFKESRSAIDFFSGKFVQLGWGITNFIAMLYLIIIPITFYYFVRHQKKYHILLVIVLDVLTLALMLSRGAYLAILITIIPFLIKFITDVKDKVTLTKIFIFMCIIVLLLLLSVAVPSGYVKTFFDALNDRGVSLSGRELIYKIGINVFLRYPLFGGGIYTSEYYISIAGENEYFHNFIIQTLATIGIVGFIAFIYYLYQILKMGIIKDKYNIYILFVIINLIIHGLFDTTFYNPLVMVMLSIILPFMVETKPKEVIV